MLRGIDSNRIVVGAYVDRESGGICPMLAAHRNGGRTSLASFARAWDRYTGAKRPRLATRREIRTLRALLESRQADDLTAPGSISEAAARIRAERAAIAEREALRGDPLEQAGTVEPADASIRARRRRDTGERHRARELRDHVRWSWMRPARRYEEFKYLLEAAEAQLAGQRAGGPFADRGAERLR